MDAARTTLQRINDALARFDKDRDCWVATVGAAKPHLVPLSFVWLDGHFYFSIPTHSRTADNVRSGGSVRLALGTTRDVVIVDGKPSVIALSEMPQRTLDRYVEKFAWDLRSTPGYVGLVVEPRRVLAWREANEIKDRTIMRAGQWLDGDE